MNMIARKISRMGGAQEESPPVLPGFDHINRYWDKTNNIHAAKILPGEYYVTANNELITTVLGSCVSACVRDRVFGIGGMNHFMLPMDGREQANSQENSLLSASTRYGNHAMEHLINDILKHGGSRKNLEVKIFGGGRILAQMTDVGRRNIEFVHDYIRVESLSLVSEDTGDVFPRKVIYFPISGRVMIKKLHSLHNDTVIDRETDYLRRLKNEPIEGEVDLF